VKINLHELLLENRHDAVQEKQTDFSERIAWKMWKQGMLRRKWMNMAGGKTKSWVVNSVIKGWKEHRGELEFPAESFNEQWKKKKRSK
jgi:L-lactate dehydrogenase complex protein LldF